MSLDAELKALKTTLRALAVSSPTAMDARTLLSDYRIIEGSELPYIQFGYTDPVRFLRAKFSDCFHFQGSENNPLLIVIVPKEMQHIYALVQKHTVSSSNRFNRSSKMKRWSVQESSVNGARREQPAAAPQEQPAAVPQKQPAAPQKQPAAPQKQTIYNAYKRIRPRVQKKQEKVKQSAASAGAATAHNNGCSEGWWQHWQPYRASSAADDVTPSLADLNITSPVPTPAPTPLATVWRRLRAAGHALSDDEDHSASSTSSASRKQRSGGAESELETLRDEMVELVTAAEGPLRCEDVPQAYRQRYRCELDVQRFGYIGIGAFALALVRHRPPLCARPDWDGQLVLLPDDTAPPPPTRFRIAARRTYELPALVVGPAEDALPGIEYDPDVFPADCIQLLETIPGVGVAWACDGRASVKVRVGEVYSPSHVWVQLLGDQHHIAMGDLVNDMTEYYARGDGKQRNLSYGAVRRVGHYCASVYDGEWHRAIILTKPDAAHRLKVRHVDYGTVDTVAVSSLKPLLRRYTELPAQAVRARLGGVRPVGGARRWSPAASAAFLGLVRDKHFVANILCVDNKESIVELLLVDTTSEIVRVDEQFVHAKYAEPHYATMEAGGVYLLPTFEAIEDALTPNYEDIRTYLRDGINLDCVPEFRRHVPSLLPPTVRPTAAVAPLTVRPTAAVAPPTVRPTAAVAPPTVRPATVAPLPPVSRAPPVATPKYASPKPPASPKPFTSAQMAFPFSRTPLVAPLPQYAFPELPSSPEPSTSALSQMAVPFDRNPPAAPPPQYASPELPSCALSPMAIPFNHAPLPFLYSSADAVAVAEESLRSASPAAAAASLPQGVPTPTPAPDELGSVFHTGTLTVKERNVYKQLQQIDPNAAHWYMTFSKFRAICRTLAVEQLVFEHAHAPVHKHAHEPSP